MANNTKEVQINVRTKSDTTTVESLERKLEEAKKKADELNREKIQMKINADTQALNDVTQKLNQAESKLNQMKSNKLFFATDTDAPQKLQQAQAEVNKLKQQQIDLQVQVESYKLDELQSKKDAIEADEINVQLNNQSAMQGLQEIADGFSRIKNSAMEVGQQFGNLLASAGKQETNFKFLENAVGNAELARQKMSEINDIVAQLPGDDTALQGLLSSAAAKDSSLTADNLRSMANSATDYFSAMSYYGKSASEAQQDMTNYLLAGNTAELERSPILQGHIDKLKEANTVQERSKALAEALNAEHWGGMGAMDTYNNKLETFNGMIERGRYTLGGMFQEGAKSAMDFLIKLDESTNGLVGMVIAASSFASPITDALIGLGQIATGINAIKETKIAEWASTAKDKLSSIGSAIRNIDFTGKFNALKTGLIDIATRARTAATSLGSTLWTAIKTVGSAAKTAAISLGKLALNVLKAGLNAAKTVAMWMASAAAKIATAAATTALAIAEWLLASPILLVVLAIVALIAILWYLYNTNDQVRAGIDWLRDSLVNAWNIIVNTVMMAVQMVIGFFQNLYTNIVTTGQNIWNSILGVLAFIATVPGRVWSYLMNIINRVVSFASNVVSRFRAAATNAVNNFINGIAQLPGKVYNELQKTLSRVMEWGSQIVSRLGQIAQQAWQAFIRGLGIGSPGYIQILTLKELFDTGKKIPTVARGIIGNLSKMAGEAVNAWGNPTFTYGFEANSKGELDTSQIELTSNADIINLLKTLIDLLKSNNNGNSTFNFTLNGDVDSEERMQQFIEAVRRELNWNNATAGRDTSKYGV